MAIKVRPRLSTTTSDSAIEAALAGFGITRLMSYQVAQHVREGRLEIVLSDCEGAALPVHLVNREGRHVAPKVRVFIDLASAALPTDDSLNDALLG